MAVNVHGDKSLYWKTGIDNSRLRRDKKETQGIFKGLKGFLTKLGIFAGIMAGLNALKNQVFDFRQKFEHAMTEVKTISDEVNASFASFSDQIRALSTEVPDSATTLTKAFYQVVSAGYDGAEGMKVLRTAAKTATAGMTDTKTAADLLTSAMNAYNVESENAQQVADNLFKTVQRGKLTIETLSGQFGELAATAAPAGIEMKEILAAIQTLTKMGMPVAQAVQRIQTGIEGIAEEQGTAWTETMTLQEKVIQMYEESGGRLENIIEKLDGEAGQFVFSLGAAADKAQEDLNAMADNAGSMEEAFNRAMESSTNQTNILVSNIRSKLLPAGELIVNAWNGILNQLNEVFESTEQHLDQLDQQKQAYADEHEQLNGLIQQYDKLRNQTNKTDEEKAQLNKTVQQIAKIAPQLATAWTQEGNAMDINRKKTKQYMEQLQDLYRFQHREQIQAAKERLETLEAERALLKTELQQGGRRTVAGGVSSFIEFSGEDIRQKKNQLKEYTDQIESLTNVIKSLRGEFGGEEDVGLGQFGLQNFNEILGEVEEKEEDTTNKRIEYIDKLKTAYDTENNALKAIAKQITALNNVSSDFNKAENRRIREQIKWWKQLYTQIQEARRLGYFQWSQQQAQKILGQMTGPSGLMPMGTDYDMDQAKQSVDEMNNSIKDAQELFYRLSDTLGDVDDELGRFIKQLSDAGMGISNVLGTIDKWSSSGGTMGAISGFGSALGVAGGWASLFKSFVDIGSSIQDTIFNMKSDFGERMGVISQMQNKTFLRDQTRNDLLNKLNESNRKISNDTYRMLRDMQGREQPERVRTPTGEPGGGEEGTTTPLQGAIRGVTEETAGLIAGRMHSMQMHVAEHVDIANSSLQTLRNIEKNTLYNKKLYDYLTTESIEVRAIGG